MEAMLTQIGSFFTQAVAWMGDILTEVAADPILLIFVVCMPVCGVAIGYLNRLIKL